MLYFAQNRQKNICNTYFLESLAKQTTTRCLWSLSVHLDALSALPVGIDWTTDSLGVSVSLAQTTWALSARGQAAQFTVLVYGVTYPVGGWVSSDRLVGWIDEDDLEELVGWVLAHPVWVQNSQGTASATNTLLKSIKLKLKHSSMALIKWTGRSS